MNTSKIALTFTQCKQIAQNTDLREFVEQVNDQPDFMNETTMGIDSISELQAIIQSGCASNAHRSVYYYDAQKCMGEHGDSVVEFIEEQGLELPVFNTGEDSWGSYCCTVLSSAIELWCYQFDEALQNVDWD